jgi:phage-related tail fiber protein
MYDGPGSGGGMQIGYKRIDGITHISFAFGGTQTTAWTGSASDITSGTLSASRLPSSGVTAGTYTSVTVDATGRVTGGTNPSSGGTPLGLILALT